MTATNVSDDFEYVGEELRLFAAARNWKNYFCKHLQAHLGNNVLEVGAGIGGTTAILCNRSFDRWLCLEPDARMTATLADRMQNRELPACCEVFHGTTKDLTETTFDTILYMDVLEHIEDDRQELEQAARLLSPGGRIVVLSPAYNWLYSPFDEAIGHFRRYSKGTLSALTPPGTTLQRIKYLDSVGTILSLSNRLVLRSRAPTASQISIWDNYVVPVSKWIDPLLDFGFGKSILAVWSRTSTS